MATVTCNNASCPYLCAGEGVRFCSANSIFINNGVCGVFFTPMGTPRNIDKIYTGVVEQDRNQYVKKPEGVSE